VHFKCKFVLNLRYTRKIIHCKLNQIYSSNGTVLICNRLLKRAVGSNNKKFELMLTRRVIAYSMPMLICNRFHEQLRLANIGKQATFTGLSFFDVFVHMFP